MTDAAPQAPSPRKQTVPETQPAPPANGNGQPAPPLSPEAVDAFALALVQLVIGFRQDPVYGPLMEAELAACRRERAEAEMTERETDAAEESSAPDG